MQPRNKPETDYAFFVSAVKAEGKVYGLQDSKGAWVVLPSQQEPDADVILFWSDATKAARHAVEEWSNHRVGEIELDIFVRAWLRGMQEDGYLVGPNWDLDLDGIEMEPFELAQRLSEKVG